MVFSRRGAGAAKVERKSPISRRDYKRAHGRSELRRALACRGGGGRKALVGIASRLEGVAAGRSQKGGSSARSERS